MKLITIFSLFIILITASDAQETQHPLDHLTPYEITSTAQIISQTYNATNSWGFNYIQLKEPAKADLLPYWLNNMDPPAGSIPRRAFAIVIDNGMGTAYEAVVNIPQWTVESWKLLPQGVQPMTSGYESSRANEAVRNNLVVRSRCEELGYHIDNVYMSDWTMGYVGDRPEYIGRRLVQMFFFGQNFEGDNYYAHPFPFVVIVDLVTFSVINIVNFPTHNDFDTENPIGVTIPRTEYQYDQDLLGEEFLRKDIKPLRLEFPEGPSYKVTGSLVEWQKFKLRIGFNAREGLVLHQISYNDDGSVRPLVYRAALSEMVVPYGDPRPPFHRKTEFDEGGYGMGIKGSLLTIDEDCIGAVHFFGGVLNDGDGNPEDFENRVCIQEEDAGILWKHTDERDSKSHVARSRRLSISFICRVDNYDYIFYWYLYQDASIQAEVKLTGILNTNMLAEGANPTPYSTPLGPQLNAQYHQHIFAVRIDVDIDGPNNTVSTVEMVGMEEETGTPGHPYGQGLVAKVTELRTAGEARTNNEPLHGRAWKITNPSKLNPTGTPVGWKLIPDNKQSMLMKMDSPVRARANFTAFNMWVTKYDDDQMFAAGYYIGQNDADGLPKWVGENPNEDITNTDIVLWHVFGVSHLPRLEDWPIMPVESCGFLLKPVGFFKQNPALDVPAIHRNLRKHEL